MERMILNWRDYRSRKFRNGNWGHRKRPADLPNYNWNFNWSSGTDRMPLQQSAKRNEERERHNEFHRCDQPQPISHDSAVPSKEKRQRTQDYHAERGLPDMVGETHSKFIPGWHVD